MIAYLSPEFAVSQKLPLYAGGLGVLAADTLKQASDYKIPMVGIGVLYKEGFFRQTIDKTGRQVPKYVEVDMGAGDLKKLDVGVRVGLDGRELFLDVWETHIQNTPLYLLDSDLSENSPEDRRITKRLYERVWAPHASADIVLGLGAVRAARALNLPIKRWHLNDDHVAFSILERLREEVEKGVSLSEAKRVIRDEFVFTTHTPVSGAESLFSYDDLKVIVGPLGVFNVDEIFELGKKRTLSGEDLFSSTMFAINLCGRVNAVSKKHETVSKKLWGRGEIFGITNGVYVPGWVGKDLAKVYDRYLGVGTPGADTSRVASHPTGGLNPPLADGGWDFSKAGDIPQDELEAAKRKQKIRLANFVKDIHGFDIDVGEPFLCWARRFAPYKRPLLLFSDRERLKKILSSSYLFVSGKAHPLDKEGNSFLEEVIKITKDKNFYGRVIFLEDYNLDLASILTQACDVWINTPKVGWEASGTSGMKALYNACLNLSTLDGWWAEGYSKDVGWKIDDGGRASEELYRVLEEDIIPTYRDRSGWGRMVKQALVKLGPRFSCMRMLKEYVERLYG